jgi:predicted  nucleic acid-binding Zn-ribbon protein
MAESRVTYVGNGSTTNYSIPFPYILRDHVTVEVNGITQLTPLHYTFLNDSTIQFVNAPVADTAILIKRTTPQDDRLVDFTNGALLTERELDLSAKQNFFLLQELNDNYNQLLEDAKMRLATDAGVQLTEAQDVIDAMVQEVLASDLLSTLQSNISSIDLNGENIIAVDLLIDEEIADRIAGDASLQTQLNTITAATAATVFVQTTAPVPGSGGVPDPIPNGARWYDSDDNNKPYIWDQSTTTWISIEDPRIAANAADIAALEVSLTAAEDDITTNASAISVLDTTVTNLDGTVTSNSADITQLQSDVTDVENDVAGQATSISSLTSRVTTAEGNITSQASDITALQADLTAAEGTITSQGTALSALTTRVTTAEGTITSQGASITALANTVNNPTTGVTATASAVSSLTTRVTTAESDIAAAESDITSIASDVTTLTTTVGTNTASISTQATSINGLEAQYTVKVDVNGRVAGFGLASTAINGTPTSEFIVVADKFAIVDPGATGSTPDVPFSYSGGVVQMQNVVIDGALIENASIGNAKIIDINASKITAGTIATSLLDIDGITLQNVGGTLQIDAVDWSTNISGAGKPDDNATDGATAGVNFDAAYAPGPSTIAIANTERSTASGSFTTCKSFQLQGTGTVTLRFRYRHDLAANGQIRVIQGASVLTLSNETVGSIASNILTVIGGGVGSFIEAEVNVTLDNRDDEIDVQFRRTSGATSFFLSDAEIRISALDGTTTTQD